MHEDMQIESSEIIKLECSNGVASWEGRKNGQGRDELEDANWIIMHILAINEKDREHGKVGVKLGSVLWAMQCLRRRQENILIRGRTWPSLPLKNGEVYWSGSRSQA